MKRTDRNQKYLYFILACSGKTRSNDREAERNACHGRTIAHPIDNTTAVHICTLDVKSVEQDMERRLVVDDTIVNWRNQWTAISEQSGTGQDERTKDTNSFRRVRVGARFP